MEADYSGSHVFTGQPPTEARASCFGCSAYDFLVKKHGYSCALGRPQRSWWTAAINLVVRPVSLACLDPGSVRPGLVDYPAWVRPALVDTHPRLLPREWLDERAEGGGL